ncbi:Flp family type IVb pilin [Arhodomonas sp. AD133]|uniref:Flp family type IVb pilin n=1 Tax=Arhodomonas sp. AD133 TaxID=3415009 RepID=UPI003EB7DDDE
MKKHTHLKKRSLGQGMTEYIIITALIAVAAIGVYGAFGDVIQDQMAGMANELSGETSDGNISDAQDNASRAETTATSTNNNLGNYDEAGTSSTN